MPAARRIIVGVSGSPGSVHALRQAADLARHHGAILIPLHAWVPPEGDVHERKHPCLELRQLWEDDAWQLLQDSLGTAFGGLPAGVRTQGAGWSAPSDALCHVRSTPLAPLRPPSVAAAGNVRPQADPAARLEGTPNRRCWLP